VPWFSCQVGGRRFTGGPETEKPAECCSSVLCSGLGRFLILVCNRELQTKSVKPCPSIAWAGTAGTAGHDKHEVGNCFNYAMRLCMRGRLFSQRPPVNALSFEVKRGCQCILCRACLQCHDTIKLLKLLSHAMPAGMFPMCSTTNTVRSTCMIICLYFLHLIRILSQLDRLRHECYNHSTYRAEWEMDLFSYSCVEYYRTLTVNILGSLARIHNHLYHDYY
jgi:hypothetical protein